MAFLSRVRKMLFMTLIGLSVVTLNTVTIRKNVSSVLDMLTAGCLLFGLPTDISAYAFLVQDIGEKERSTMSEQNDYTDEPLQIGERVEDFLPPPSQLVKREETVKVTIELTRESLEFFKQQARQQKIPYQRMLQGLIDAYAKQHSLPPS
jgi:predicted DNA binding CopG/RHH family protein